MAEKSLSKTRISGEKVQLIYIWHKHILYYSAITCKNGEFLEGFQKKGHFPVKITKAVVRTSHPPDPFKKGNLCSLITRKQPDAPPIIDKDMEAVVGICEMTISDKRKELNTGSTYPVVIEKVKSDNIFATRFPDDQSLKYFYKPHNPKLFKACPIQGKEDEERKCNTANAVKFSPPVVFLYGPKYAYKLFLKTDQPVLLDPNPTMIINFYGRIYETTHSEYVGYKDGYFAGLTSILYNEEEVDPESGEDFVHFESDVDDYDYDTSDEELQDEVSEDLSTTPHNDEDQNVEQPAPSWDDVAIMLAERPHRRRAPKTVKGDWSNNP